MNSYFEVKLIFLNFVLSSLSYCLCSLGCLLCSFYSNVPSSLLKNLEYTFSSNFDLHYMSLLYSNSILFQHLIVLSCVTFGFREAFLLTNYVASLSIQVHLWNFLQNYNFLGHSPFQLAIKVSFKLSIFWYLKCCC